MGILTKCVFAKIKMSPDFSDELLKQSSRSYGMKKRCNEYMWSNDRDL